MPNFRAVSALLLVASLLLLAWVPACDSESCPMSGSARAACRTMGRDCCKPAAQRLAPGSTAPPLSDLSLAPVDLLSDSAALGGNAVPRPAAAILPVPAVLQGVGLHVLYAVFRI